MNPFVAKIYKKYEEEPIKLKTNKMLKDLLSTIMFLVL